MISESSLNRFALMVQTVPGLRGVGVGYSGSGQSRIISKPDQQLAEGLRTWVIIFEDDLYGNANLFYSPQAIVRQLEAISQQAGTSRKPPTRWQAFLHEAPTAVLSCGSAGIAAFVEVGSVIAAPITAGSSLAVTTLTAVGMWASYLQCYNSLGRLVNTLIDPQQNDELDSQGWYQLASNSLDAIALTGDVMGLKQASTAIIRLSRSSGRPVNSLLRSLERAERRRIAKELGIAMSQNNNRLFKELARAGKLPSIYSSYQINRAVILQLWSMLAAGLDVTGSTRDGVIRQIVIVSE